MALLKSCQKIVGEALARPDLKINLWLWGPPGVGKSSVVHTEARRLGLPVIDLRGVTCDPTDVRGFPMVQDGVVRWARPEFLPSEGEGVLFLDELGQAPALVQAALLQLTLDRRVGEHLLPPGWRIIAASNRLTDRAGVGRLNTALLDRFVHLEVEIAAEEWNEWALDAGIGSQVRSFLQFRPQLLSAFDPAERVSPSPRSWATAARLIALLGSEPVLLHTALAGTVGAGPAAELSAFLRCYETLPSLAEILRHPESIKIPKDPSLCYALAGLPGELAREAKPAGVNALCKLAIRLPAEFAVVALRDLVRLRPELVVRNAQVRAFLVEHKHLISSGESLGAAA